VPFKEPVSTARIPITLMVSSVVAALLCSVQIDGIPLDVVKEKYCELPKLHPILSL
jgi:hypothetical protein